MANDWTTNPAVIDTAEDKTGTFIVSAMEWYPNAADNDIEVQDGSGNVLFKFRSIYGSPNHEESGRISKVIDRICYGLNVVTIDAGTLYITLR